MKYEDIQIDIFRADTDKVNAYSNGVRVTHKPTGTSATMTYATLEENKRSCIEALKLMMREEIE